MAQRCSYCGRTEKKHVGPDGKYQACFAIGPTGLTPQTPTQDWVKRWPELARDE